MQVIEVTKQTYPEGERVDVTEKFISNGYREPARNRRTYEFTATSGKKIYNEDDIVEVNIMNFGFYPTAELLSKHPDLAWDDWFDQTEDGTPIEDALENL